MRAKRANFLVFSQKIMLYFEPKLISFILLQSYKQKIIVLPTRFSQRITEIHDTLGLGGWGDETSFRTPLFMDLGLNQ